MSTNTLPTRLDWDNAVRASALNLLAADELTVNTTRDKDFIATGWPETTHYAKWVADHRNYVTQLRAWSTTPAVPVAPVSAPATPKVVPKASPATAAAAPSTPTTPAKAS